MDQDSREELERLRARVRELESLEHRVEYAHAMARQLRAQAADIVGSRAWRLLTGGGSIWLRLTRKLRPRQPAAGITRARYYRWMADCERREFAVHEGGPRFSVVATGPRTLASLRAQTYKAWDAVASAAEARGDYVLLPGADDELSPDALYLFARAAAGGADLVYCDEDRLDAEGLRCDPWFKPDWSPDFMAERDYIGRAKAIRTALLNGEPRHIVHVPRVLYHARDICPGETRRVRHPSGGRVDIVVPSRNPRLLAGCLANIRSHTAYRNYGFTVIDNSAGGEIASIAERHSARYLDWRRQPFNYSAMNNAAAAGAGADLLLFLNDDVAAADPGWLEAMVEHAARPEVGAVGARLLYPDGRIQHAGVVIGIFGVCGHAFKGWPANTPTYGRLAETARNVSAVTGACLMVRPAVFSQVGCFDAQSFPVAYNDIDLCLRIREAGLRVVYTPYATLQHHEAFSKPRSQRDPEMAEIRAFQNRWKTYIEHDPFYNPNLTRADESYGLRSADEWICPGA